MGLRGPQRFKEPEESLLLAELVGVDQAKE